MRFLRIRLGVVFAILLSLGTLLFGGWGLWERIGQPWSGLPVSPPGYLGPDFLVERDLKVATRGLTPSDRIVSVDGIRVSAGREVQDLLAGYAPGQRVIYGLQAPDGRRSQIELPVQVLDTQYLRTSILPLLAIGLSFLALAFLPIMARPELPLARATFALAYGVVSFINFGVPDIFLLHWFVPWNYVFAIFFYGGLFHFALLFPVQRWPYTTHSRLTVSLVYGGAALFTGVYCWTIEQAPAWIPAMRMVGAGVVLSAGGILILNLGKAAWSAEDPRIRRLGRLGLVAPVMSVVFILGLVLTSWGGVEVAPVVLFLPLIVVVFCILYATVVDNIFDIDEVVRHLIAFFAVGLVAVATYIGILGLLSLVVDASIAWAGVTLAALAMVLLAPVIPLLYASAEDFVEAALFPGRRRARVVIEKATRELGRLRRPSELVDFLDEAIAEALPGSFARFVLGKPGEPLVEVAAPPGQRALTLPPADALYTALARGQSVRVQDRVGERQHLPQGASARCRELQLSLAIPLPPGDAVVGGILLGEREDGRPYVAREEGLIAILAQQVSTSLENAAAWGEVELLRERLEKENQYLREKVNVEMHAGDIVGSSDAVREMVGQIHQVAETDSSVLLVGETGTGKELAVRAIHGLSARANFPLAQVACAALPETLLESELFGFEKGAFSGAETRRDGRIEAAEGGTFFLDDVDTLPLGVQAKLLRAIQEGEVQRLGSNEVRRVNVRIVASTNRDLLAEVRAGRFREDLYYRLAVVPIRLPPLRERREDIPVLAQHFVEMESVRLGRQVLGISAGMMEALEAYDWPGNIRELRNVIERALVLCRQDVLRLPGPIEAGGRPSSSVSDADSEKGAELGEASLTELVRRYKKELVMMALARSGGNQRRAAELLGMHRPSLTRMIRDLGLRDDPS